MYIVTDSAWATNYVFKLNAFILDRLDRNTADRLRCCQSDAQQCDDHPPTVERLFNVLNEIRWTRAQQSLDSRSTVAQQSLDSRSTVAQQSLNTRSTVARQSLNSRSTVAQQSINSRSTVARHSLNSRSTVARQSLNSRLTVARVHPRSHIELDYLVDLFDSNSSRNSKISMSRDERPCRIYYSGPSFTETGNACCHLNRRMASRMNRCLVGQTVYNSFGKRRWKVSESWIYDLMNNTYYLIKDENYNWFLRIINIEKIIARNLRTTTPRRCYDIFGRWR